MKTFVIPGTLKFKGRRKPQSVSLFLEADDREHARWQMWHGVIEMNVRQSFPDATVIYDKRRITQQ